MDDSTSPDRLRRQRGTARRRAPAGALAARLVGGVALALLTSAALPAAEAERQVWDLGTLQPGRVFPTTATAVNRSCPGRHDFEVSVEDAPWFRITGPTVLRGIGVRQQKSTDAEVDTRGLAPGDYSGLLKIRCLTCPPPPVCTQDLTELEVRLRIPSEEELYDPIPGGELPPTESRCGVLSVEGRFEPTQGVWQDDPVFSDKRGKQLRQVNPRLYEAELAMVAGRTTTLFGTIRPVGGTAEDRRQEIFLRGTADGSRPVAVRIRVSAIQGSGSREVWTSERSVEIPIGRPCRPGGETPFEVAADVGTGAGDFQLAAGRYVLEAELIRDDESGTGIRARVFGDAVETQAPRVLFRPIYVTPLAPEAAGALQRTTEDLERRSAREIPDWFPLRAASLVTRTLDTRDAAPALVDREAVERIRARFRPADAGELGRLILREAINRQFRASALFDGFDRVIVTLGSGDFDHLRTGPVRRAVAFTNSRKVSFLDVDTAPFTWTVAHELSHTLPYPWTSEEVAAECGADYHDKLGREAHGLRLTRAGEPERGRLDGVIPVIAQATRDAPWIAQCTYWHHLKALVGGPPDPPVVLAQGYVALENGRAGAALLPAYQFDSVPDLEEGAGGDWAIELLDAGEAVLARYPFAPEWTFADTGARRSVVSFGYRVAERPGTAALRVTGPNGATDILRYSARAPEVEIVEPRRKRVALPDDGRLRLAWRGNDRDGDELLYSVLHSEDGGTTWADLAFETAATELDVRLDPAAGPHAVRVVVTDGARSAEARLDLRP